MIIKEDAIMKDLEEALKVLRTNYQDPSRSCHLLLGLVAHHRSHCPGAFRCPSRYSYRRSSRFGTHRPLAEKRASSSWACHHLKRCRPQFVSASRRIRHNPGRRAHDIRLLEPHLWLLPWHCLVWRKLEAARFHRPPGQSWTGCRSQRLPLPRSLGVGRSLHGWLH